MKKIFLLIITLSIIGVSCQDEFEPGETNAAPFAGTWYYQLRASDGSIYWDFDDVYPDATGEEHPFLTYNSADNTSTEVWFDDQEWNGLLKAKFTIVGTPENFKAGIVVNELYAETPDVISTDEVDGKQVIINANDDYYLAEIVEGKILKGAATVWADLEKAKSDSIYVKFAFHGADFHYTVKRNIKIDSVTRVVPTVPPSDSAVWDTTFVYVRDALFFDVLDPIDTLIITGHRKTGWEYDFRN